MEMNLAIEACNLRVDKEECLDRLNLLPKEEIEEGIKTETEDHLNTARMISDYTKGKLQDEIILASIAQDHHLISENYYKILIPFEEDMKPDWDEWRNR